MERIYLDNNATTSLAPEVLEAMLLDLKGGPLNPSSTHYFGQKAKGLLTNARNTVANFFGVKSKEILFTGSGTESLNHLIHGSLKGNYKGTIISTGIEHAAVINTLKVCKDRGSTLMLLRVDETGAPTPESLIEAITPDTRLIVLSAANGETGVKLDMNEMARIASSHQIPLIIDGVALLGKELFTIPDGVTGIAFAPHKFHGPKGVGITVIRSPHTLLPFLCGGAQEGARRAGTENLAAILGAARAIELLDNTLPKSTEHMRELQHTFEQTLLSTIPGLEVNGTGDRLPNTSNIAFPNIDGETLLIHLDMQGIAASHGSACTAGSLEPSRILTNMDYPKKRVMSSVRFSFSRYTTKEEIEKTILVLQRLCRCT